MAEGEQSSALLEQLLGGAEALPEEVSAIAGSGSRATGHLGRSRPPKLLARSFAGPDRRRLPGVPAQGGRAAGRGAPIVWLPLPLPPLTRRSPAAACPCRPHAQITAATLARRCCSRCTPRWRSSTQQRMRTTRAAVARRPPARPTQPSWRQPPPSLPRWRRCRSSRRLRARTPRWLSWRRWRRSTPRCCRRCRRPPPLPPRCEWRPSCSSGWRTLMLLPRRGPTARPPGLEWSSRRGCRRCPAARARRRRWRRGWSRWVNTCWRWQTPAGEWTPPAACPCWRPRPAPTSSSSSSRGSRAAARRLAPPRRRGWARRGALCRCSGCCRRRCRQRLHSSWSSLWRRSWPRVREAAAPARTTCLLAGGPLPHAVLRAVGARCPARLPRPHPPLPAPPRPALAHRTRAEHDPGLVTDSPAGSVASSNLSRATAAGGGRGGSSVERLLYKALRALAEQVRWAGRALQ